MSDIILKVLRMKADTAIEKHGGYIVFNSKNPGYSFWLSGAEWKYYQTITA